VGEAVVWSPARACGAAKCASSSQSPSGWAVGDATVGWAAVGSPHSAGSRPRRPGRGSRQSRAAGRGSSHERRAAGAGASRPAGGGGAARVRPAARRATSSRHARGESDVTGSAGGRCCTAAPRVAAAAAAASSHGRAALSGAGWTVVILGMSWSCGSGGGASASRGGGHSDQPSDSQSPEPRAWPGPRGGWSLPSWSAGRALRPSRFRLARSGLRRGDGGRAGLSVCPPTTSQRAPLGRS